MPFYFLRSLFVLEEYLFMIVIKKMKLHIFSFISSIIHFSIPR